MSMENWFREHSPAEIIAKVTEIGLTEISTWSEEYLEKVGWTDNAIIKELYSLTSTGIWAVYQVDGSSPILKRLRDDLLNTKTEVTAIDTAVLANGGKLDLLTACIDGNRLKTIETP